MPILNLTKYQLASVCAIGGSCIAGVPIVLHYTQDGLVEPEDHLREPSVRTNDQVFQVSVQEENLEDSNKKLVAETQKADDFSQKNDQAFEELWSKITEGYRKLQKDQSNNHPSWKEELKVILLLEESSSDTWKIMEEIYKDCSHISGGKTDYCGYLSLSKDAYNYKLKFDKYGQGGGGRKWDVSLVRKKRGNAEYYSRKEQKWVTAPTHDLNNFQGENKAQYNWWGKLASKTIEI